MRKTVKVLSLLSLFATAGASVALAVECPPWAPTSLCDSGGNLILDLNSIIRLALYTIIAAGVLWTLWNIIAAGFAWAGSGGDEEKRGKATKKIISALVGLLIIVVSFTAMSVVVSLVGVSPTDTKIGYPCVNEDGQGGLWTVQDDLDNDGEIDKNECKVVE